MSNTQENTDNFFKSSKLLNDYSNSNPDKLIMIFFTATWCNPCKLLYPYVAEKKEQYDGVCFSKIDVDNDEYQELCDDFSIQAMPTFLFYKNGLEIEKIVGGDKDKIETLLSNNK